MPSYPNVSKFEQLAEEIHDQAKKRGDEVDGLTPWYSSVELIERGAKVAFIGANDPGKAMDENYCLRLKKPHEDSSYNHWLDERPPNSDLDPHQKRVQSAFIILFGRHANEALRKTASFHLAPMRTPKVPELSKDTRDDCAEWIVRVVEHVSPKLIICNGNDDRRGLSPWSAVKNSFGITDEDKELIPGINVNRYLKCGTIPQGELKGVEVIAWPSLGSTGVAIPLDGLQKVAEQMGVIDRVREIVKD